MPVTVLYLKQTKEPIMNQYLVLGLFALYVVVVSALRLLAEDEHPALTKMKRLWGRTTGLILHFLLAVIFPLLFGIFYLCRGVVSFIS